jgi:hypothetical protein
MQAGVRGGLGGDSHEGCPALITCAEGSRFSPRLGRSPVVLLDDVAGAGQ